MRVCTTLGTPFTGLTSIPDADVPVVPGTETPFYISQNATPLNRFYNPIQLPIIATPNAENTYLDVFTHEEFSLIYEPGGFAAMPAPHRFNSFEAYFAALTTWFTYSLRYFGFAQLPSPISGTFHLPELPKIFTNEEKNDRRRFRTFKATFWPLLPENYCDMLERVFQRRPIVPDEPFQYQIPKRELIYYHHHVSSEDQWQAQLIPREPFPGLYETYEEYRDAYMNWAIISSKSLTIPIVSVAEFQGIALLHPVPRPQRRVVRSPSAPSLLIALDPRRCQSSMDLGWVKPLTHPVNIDGLGTGRSYVAVSDRAVEAFGMNSKAFVADHISFGISTTMLQTEGPYVAPIVWAMSRDGFDDAYSLLMQAATFDFDLIRQLLDIEVSCESMRRLMTVLLSGERVVAVMSQILSSLPAISQLERVSQISESYRFRVSFLLSSVFQLDGDTQILKIMLGLDTIEPLAMLVKTVNLTSANREALVPLIGDPEPSFHKINLYYLLSVFLTITRESAGSRWYRDALNPCRQLCYEVGTFIRDHLNEVRRSDADSPFAVAMVMIFGAESIQLQALVLGLDFLNWMPPQLMCRVEHSRVILTATRALLLALSERVYEPIGDWVAQMPAHIAFFIESACGVLRRRARDQQIRVPGQSIMSLFDAVLASPRVEVGYLVLPIGRLLADADVVSNFGDPAFQQRLQASICWLCMGLPQASPALYRYRMQALASLAHDEGTCFQIARNSDFSAFLVGRLTDTDSSIIPIHWAVFRVYTAYSSVLGHLLNKKEIAVKIAQIVSCDSTAVLRRFFEWSIFVWKKHEEEVAVKFCDVMQPVLGQLTCIVKARRLMFKDDETLVKLIEEYAIALVELEPPGAEKFIEAFSKHMEIADARDELMAPRRTRIRRETIRMMMG
jgi:hypothetical protein